jgi:acetyl esterase/lipase
MGRSRGNHFPEWRNAGGSAPQKGIPRESTSKRNHAKIPSQDHYPGCPDDPRRYVRAGRNRRSSFGYGRLVDGSEPPFLLIHGLDDSTVEPEQSKYFAETLERAGVEVELLLIPDADHGAILNSEQSFEAVEDFLATLAQASTREQEEGKCLSAIPTLSLPSSGSCCSR